MILEIKNLTKVFGGLKAVDNLNLSIEQGEILGLIGPNGAGKTTVFNLVNGFLSPDSGDIVFKKESIRGLRPDIICKKGIGRIFQLVKPFESMSVLDNVMVGSLSRMSSIKKAKKMGEEILEFTELSEKKDFLPGNLTIADRKRLELARALCAKPELLLLDELFGGLNPKEIDKALILVRKIRSKGITIFIIEHVMQAVMSLSERIAVINYGRKIVEGCPQEIAKNEEVIKAYLGEKYVTT